MTSTNTIRRQIATPTGRNECSPRSKSSGSPTPDAFAKMIADAGFAQAKVEPMLGGLVCIWSGWKI